MKAKALRHMLVVRKIGNKVCVWWNLCYIYFSQFSAIFINKFDNLTQKPIFPCIDFGRLLVYQTECYSEPKNHVKHSVAICLMFGHFLHRLTGLICKTCIHLKVIVLEPLHLKFISIFLRICIPFHGENYCCFFRFNCTFYLQMGFLLCKQFVNMSIASCYPPTVVYAERKV